MSLVIAFIGRSGAVMAGDMREIAFQGDDSCIEELERELYGGSIASDAALAERAAEIGVTIHVRDDKVKVASQQDGVLVGEVTETEGASVRCRRLYATRGSYVIAEIVDSRMEVTKRGRASNFVVLGNDTTKRIANQCIQEAWDGGTLQDAMRLIMLTMQIAASVTASVSRTFVLVHTDQAVDLTHATGQGLC
ncbi:MJ0548 connectase family domain-containing protein [Methanoculleus sp.]|uniref:MJ0548 connectase family domain-containing protein n=1 Tax=Methanoculleus sp. TaxID=90427 RepID=UPI002FC9CF5F